MANLYCRHPVWRLSPYAGLGAGIFFYDAKIDTQLDIDPEGLFGDFLPGEDPGEVLPPLTTTLRQEERRFGFQLMKGLSFQVRPRVELRVGYRYRSGRDGPVNSDQVEGGIRFRFRMVAPGPCPKYRHCNGPCFPWQVERRRPACCKQTRAKL